MTGRLTGLGKTTALSQTALSLIPHGVQASDLARLTTEVDEFRSIIENPFTGIASR